MLGDAARQTIHLAGELTQGGKRGAGGRFSPAFRGHASHGISDDVQPMGPNQRNGESDGDGDGHGGKGGQRCGPMREHHHQQGADRRRGKAEGMGENAHGRLSCPQLQRAQSCHLVALSRPR